MSNYAKKSDSNQAAIVEVLRAAGLTVESLHRVGGGVPDLLVGGNMPCPHCGYFFPQNRLIEIKKLKGVLNATQIGWHSRWNGQAGVARTPETALFIAGRGDDGSRATPETDIRFIDRETGSVHPEA